MYHHIFLFVIFYIKFTPSRSADLPKRKVALDDIETGVIRFLSRLGLAYGVNQTHFLSARDYVRSRARFESKGGARVRYRSETVFLSIVLDSGGSTKSESTLNSIGTGVPGSLLECHRQSQTIAVDSGGSPESETTLNSIGTGVPVSL